MNVKKILVYIEDDRDGSTKALRSWLESAGPDVPWEVEPPGPAEGMGLSADQYISLIFGAMGAANALADVTRRILEWHRSRRVDAEPPTMRILIETDGQLYEGTLTPVDDADDWPS